MLISRVPDETGGEGRGEPGTAEDIAHNFQTASELFELMTKDHDFEAGDDALSARNLVLLYKNLDLGNKLMSNVNEIKRQKSNQYVEDVIYHDDGSDSDLSDYGAEDLHNIMLANKERIDLFTDQPSLNSLCHKLGDLEIQVSNISTDYDRSFLFKDPYVKDQLKSLQLMSKANEQDTTMLPTSLLDYICCKRLEDNYNFYMDNIIRYVMNTIEQLKRISNGDYLPERVKEKWREVEHGTPDSDSTSKVLTSSISIPLQVERKVTGLTTNWDDIVRSEVDLRSLVRILEKKIVLEVPKVICGSYKLFSKYDAENLIITCKRKKQAPADPDESSVNVVVQLQRSSTGQVLGNIESIMVLQPRQQIAQKECTKVLPLTFVTEKQPIKLKPKIGELPVLFSQTETSAMSTSEFTSLGSYTDYRSGDYGSKISLSSKIMKPDSPSSVSQILSSVSRVVRAETAANHVTPNELHFSMVNLNRESSLPEEGSAESLNYQKTRKKSPTKVRIKSPYENKSAIVEERKRRRLLEVRERRERRKMARDENSRVSKHKSLPQAVSSVTKLSITNKAFYNSIYGQSIDTTKKISPTSFNDVKVRKEKQDKGGVIQEMDQEYRTQSVERQSITSDKDMNINDKCHFLDEAETEMSYLQGKMDKRFLRNSASTSVASNESATNLYIQSDYCPSLTSLYESTQESLTTLGKQRLESKVEVLTEESREDEVPTNSPICRDSEKVMAAVECRRSLEKICTLMKKLREIESNETSKKKPSISSETRALWSSESGTSVKHRYFYTDPSSTSFEKPYDVEGDRTNIEGETDRLATVVPKVVISTKRLSGTKTEEPKKIRKPKVPRIRTIPENPLRAISQLLQEFDNVQKSRQKLADPKPANRSMSTDARTVARPEAQKRRSRIETLPAKDDSLSKVAAKVKTRFTSREEMRPEILKTQILDKKNINDLIDEVKEARGEAVRGPPKLSSRLNMLAQPKRAYVQALNEQFLRRQTPERPPREPAPAPRARRRAGDSPASLVAAKPPHSLERTGRPRRSAGSSPTGARAREPAQSPPPAPGAASPLRPAIKKKTAGTDSLVSSPLDRSPDRIETTRAPLVPKDLLFSLSSSPVTEGSGSRAIGSKLHLMVESVLRAERPSLRPRSAAACISEEHEITTVVEEPSPEKHKHRNYRRKHDRLDVINAVTPVNSVAELEKLEHALHRRLSSGTFPGRLRIKKLTLTPKPSLQQNSIHDSGDTTSIVFQSDISQKITVTTKSSGGKTDLMALLSTTPMNCGLFGPPLQISTVGYVFPILKGEVKKIKPKRFGAGFMDMADAGPACTVSEKMSRMTTLVVTDEEETVCRYIMEQPRPTTAEYAVQISGSDIFRTTAKSFGRSLLNMADAGTTCMVSKKLTTLFKIADEEDTICQHFLEQPRPATAEYAVQISGSDMVCTTTKVAEKVCTPSKNVETSTTEASTTKSHSSEIVGQNKVLGIGAAEEKYELADYTASLDLLVGLLNEIQKITTTVDEASNTQATDVPSQEPSTSVGVSTFNEFPHPETDSFFSLFVTNTNESNDERIEIIPKTNTNSVGVDARTVECKPVCADKEVWAKVPAPQHHVLVNTDSVIIAHEAKHPNPSPHDAETCTMNVPTSSCAISTVTNSEHFDVASNTSVTSVKSDDQTEINCNKVKSLVPFYDNMFKVEQAKKRTVVTCERTMQGTVPKKSSANRDNPVVGSDRTYKISNKCGKVKVQNAKTIVSNQCLQAGDFDFTFQRKREVLVTFYSILVLTVFAALAFPEITFVQQV